MQGPEREQALVQALVQVAEEAEEAAAEEVEAMEQVQAQAQAALALVSVGRWESLYAAFRVLSRPLQNHHHRYLKYRSLEATALI